MGAVFSTISSYLGFATPRPQQNTTLMTLPTNVQEYIIEVLISSDISGACALASTCRQLRNSMRVFVRLPGINTGPNRILSARSLLCGRKIGIRFAYFPIIAIGEIQNLDMRCHEMFILKESNGFADTLQSIRDAFAEHHPVSPRNQVYTASPSYSGGLYIRLATTCVMNNCKVGDKVRIYGTFQERMETRLSDAVGGERIIEYFANVIRVLV